MKKNDVWNQEINPDGISNELKGLEPLVWFGGYFLKTDDGVWYEVYVNDTIKKETPNIDLSNTEDKETYENFHNINFDHYKDDKQITFFVPNDESKYTLDELTDILI